MLNDYKSPYKDLLKRSGKLNMNQRRTRHNLTIHNLTQNS